MSSTCASPRDARAIEPGDFILARVARIPDEHQVFGVPIRVPPPLRAATMALVDSEPDATDLARWYGQVMAASAPTGGVAARWCCAGPSDYG